MTKKEFITFLNQRLSILNERERREIIDEYVQHIDLKIEEGKTEAEAIRDFGDLNEFVDEILEAYHVNPKANSAENFIVDLVNKIANGISAIANSIVSMKSDKIISLIIEVFLLIIVLAVVRWPFRLILEAFFSILFFLPYGIERLFVFIFDICYAIIALAVMYTF